MGAIAQLFGVRPAVKSAGVPSISSDGTFSVIPSFSWLGFGVPTRSGVSVSEDAALAIPTVYACVRVLAESIASLPLIMYRRLPNGGKERATDHLLYPVFHDQPNPEMTSFGWRETLMTHEGTWGNSYNEIVDGPFGRPEIWPLPPARVIVGWESGRKVYDYLSDGGERKRLDDGSVFHIPGLSTNGLVGLSPIQAHREALGEMIATREFGANFYRNSARPAIVLEHPAGLSAGAIERLATQMDQMRGSGNAGKTIVAEEGMKIHEVGIPPEDAQYIETRKLQREDVCQMYRMQPHMVGILDHGTYANVEQESLNFVVHTLRPWLVRIEQAINAFFLAHEPDVFVEFLVDGLLRGDAVTRAQALMIRREAGTLRKNEWRAIENMNPDPEDDVWIPAANHTAVTIDENGNPTQVQPAEAPRVEPVPLVDRTSAAGIQPPKLTVIKSAAVRCEGRLATGETCDKLLIEMATPPYRATCPRCKTVASKSADEDVIVDEDDDELPVLRAEVRSMAAYIDAQKSAPEPVRVEVLPPVVNVPAPIVNVQPHDNRPVLVALHRMEEALLAPRRKNLIRDADGRITGVEEVPA